MLHRDWDITDEQVLAMYRLMYTTRRVDEKNWLLNRSGKVQFVISGQGHEACQVAMAFALNKQKDYIAPYYRDLGLVLGFGMSIKEIFLSYFAKKEDPNSKGIQMPHHFSSRKLKIITQSSCVSTQLLHAVGLTYAAKLDGKTDIVCLCSFGEGSSNQGEVHEAMNFASIYQLPVIFVCENNEYAISTNSDKQYHCARLSDRALGYGMYGETVDGMDLLQTYGLMKKAVEQARLGKGPSFIEAKVKRFTAHSSDDDARHYMNPEEISRIKTIDPLHKFKNYLKENQILSEAIENTLHTEIEKEIDEAIAYADRAEFLSEENILDNVYTEKTI